MSNALKRLLDLMPKAPEFIGTITSEDHPNYKVLVVDGSGLVLCSSNSKYSVGDRVVVSENEIKRSAPTGAVVQIEV
ncbi:hypothetical protein [Acinetobacter sp. ANC 4648]|uniref:hypothetical protein n=1 Tax=Acinetobacter sp. ANC 4648 TaxID=1977875 RepID=UPI000A358D84|nr:hypothetical protein [Acinetobacter sp. ANC 4648]OTG80265.1 hypothetical protein B9T27_12890 [Acinetobacter sp. ANC 4648]